MYKKLIIFLFLFFFSFSFSCDFNRVHLAKNLKSHFLYQNTILRKAIKLMHEKLSQKDRAGYKKINVKSVTHELSVLDSESLFPTKIYESKNQFLRDLLIKLSKGIGNNTEKIISRYITKAKIELNKSKRQFDDLKIQIPSTCQEDASE